MKTAENRHLGVALIVNGLTVFSGLLQEDSGLKIHDLLARIMITQSDKSFIRFAAMPRRRVIVAGVGI